MGYEEEIGLHMTWRSRMRESRMAKGDQFTSCLAGR